MAHAPVGQISIWFISDGDGTRRESRSLLLILFDPLQQTGLASWVNQEFRMEMALVLIILDSFHKEVGLLLRGGGLNAMPQVHDMPLLATHLEDRLCC